MRLRILTPAIKSSRKSEVTDTLGIPLIILSIRYDITWKNSVCHFSMENRTIQILQTLI